MEFWLIYLILGLFALVLVLSFVVLYKKWRKQLFRSEELKYIQAHWIRIIDSFGTHAKNSVLDADKLLDYALKKKGFEGTLGEKLKKAGSRFSDLNGLWNAHRLRNKIAHELTELDLKEAKSALGSFKKALNDLGAKL